MDKIDVAVVGGGLAGLSCAYKLAEAGLQVIVVERGDFPGSKNVTGGRFYVNPVRPFAGDMFDGAPFERKVVREQWSLLGGTNSINIDFTSQKFREEEHSYTVLRAHLDRWLSDKLVAKGVFVIPKHRVDDLLWENGAVAGIVSGAEKIPAHVVVAADGVLSFVAGKAGLKTKMTPGNYAVAMKEVIELPEEKINDRFNVESGEGCAHLYAGDVTKGVFGGGFLYTNKNTVSIGIVAGIKALRERSQASDAYLLLDDFKERYEIKRLLGGGNLVEYSAHIIPEGGYRGISKLYGDGIIVVGDAAGFALNLGVTVRGMEFAVASGVIAAQRIISAKAAGNFSSSSLAGYEKDLAESFVLKDMKTNEAMPAFLEGQDDLYSFYPQKFPEFLEKIMWFDAGPKEKIGKTLRKEMKTSGMTSLKRLWNLYSMTKL